MSLTNFEEIPYDFEDIDIPEDIDFEKYEKTIKKQKKKIKITNFFILFTSLLLALGMLYLTIIFGTFSKVTELRDLYIETAMTTGEHQWLATAFFPQEIINSVMSKKTLQTEISSADKVTVAAEDITPDILKQRKLKVGDLDYAGNKILVNDIEQGIIISEIVGENFKGKIVLIDDPSRVSLKMSNQLGSRGEFLCDYLDEHDAIVGMNASGFVDKGGHGTGGLLTSKCMSEGKEYGTYANETITCGFNKNNKLIVGNIHERNWNNYEFRDCYQFYPALIIDGKQMVTGSAGWGIQPRTVIGQRNDGIVFFLIIDGRQIGYSIGATMGDCAEILLKYGAVNAAACDGGSSSVLAYNSELINTPSTPMKETGRYLPNAWVVKRK